MRLQWGFLAGLILAVAGAAAFGANWSQWRGPEFNGSSDTRDLTASLDPNTLLWKTALPGLSAATPVIFGGKVFLPSTETDSDRLLAMCVDAASGTILWERPAAVANQRLGRGNTLASCSACADETGAVFMFGEGTLVKFSPAGEQLWKRNIVEAYGPLVLDFGFSSSPLLAEGKLYIPVLRRTRARRSEDTADLASYLLCVDNGTGQTVFKNNRPTDAIEESTNAYTTPVPVKFDGQLQILVYGGDYLTAHDPTDGHELWRYGYVSQRERMDRVIPTPVADGERIYCVYPRGMKTFAVEPGDEPKQAWVHDQRGPDVPCPALYKGHLYLIEEKQKTLTCLEAATGAVQWIGQLDKRDMYYASVTAADDKLYLVNRKGVITVAAADPAAFRILSTYDAGEYPVDSTIAAANAAIFLRTPEHLYCWGTSTGR